MLKHLFEYNSLLELMAIGIIPSTFSLVIIALLMKIIHMHKNNTSRVIKFALARQKKEIELYNDYLYHQKRVEQLKTDRLGHNKDVNDVYSNTNLLREKIARYKAANDEIRSRREDEY